MDNINQMNKEEIKTISEVVNGGRSYSIIYILDSQDPRVVVLSTNVDHVEMLYEVGKYRPKPQYYGDYKQTCSNPDQALCEPKDFAATKDGLLWVIDRKDCNNDYQYGQQNSGLAPYRIMVFRATTGEFTQQRLFRSGYADGSFGNQIGGIAITHDRIIYIADTEYDRVQVFNQDFQYLFQFGYAGVRSGQFNRSMQIIVTENYLYVRDSNRIQQFALITFNTTSSS